MGTCIRRGDDGAPGLSWTLGIHRVTFIFAFSGLGAVLSARTRVIARLGPERDFLGLLLLLLGLA